MKRLHDTWPIVPIVSLLILFSHPAAAQFDLGKLKKAGEKIQKTLTPEECQPLQNLKQRIKLIKDDLARKETQMLKMHFEYGREYITEIKTKCPGVEYTSYETELNDLEMQAKATRESNAASATQTEDAETQMKNASRSVDFIFDLRSPYKGMYASKDAAQQFLDKCKEVNYDARKSEIEKLADANPDFRRQGSEMNSYYKRYTAELPQKLADVVPGFFTEEINRNIEEAYAQKGKGKSNLGKAVEAAEAALFLCDGLLLFEPNNSGIQQLRKDAKTIVDETGGAFSSAIFTSDFHKRNAGRIVFSKAKLNVSQVDESKVIGAFTSADWIYGTVYLKGTFREVTKEDWNVYLKIEVDGNQKVDRKFSISTEKRDATFLNIELAPDPSTAETQGAETYAKAFGELSPRRHRIKVKLDGGYTTLAEGEFELDCTGGVDRFTKISEQLRSKRLSSVRMPEPAMKNPALEKEMLAASDHPEDKPLRVVITGSEWTVHRHPISGAIEFRTINAALATKRQSDGTCRIFFVSFKQNYNGRSYGKTEHYGVGDNAEIPCENVMR